MRAAQGQRAQQRQAQALGTRQLESLGLLMKSLPELRAELVREISENPVLEDLDHPLEVPLSDTLRERDRAESESMPDYPEDRYEPVVNRDDDAAERRQAFFDNQVKVETLQDHLLAQLPLSDIAEADWPLVGVLVGDLDDSGFYRGSVVDACMAFGRTEAQVREVLAKVAALDPPGCGATTVRECLLAQLDGRDDLPHRETVRQIVDGQLERVAAGRLDEVAAAFGISRDELGQALRSLRSLDARPGSRFPGERDRVEYVNPEVHAERAGERWYAVTDKRSLPEIRVAKKYLELLKDPAQTEETKEYVRSRIASAKSLREAVERRQETVENIAQEIFDRQQSFFTRGFAALGPLTETEVAKAVGVDVATVSRTVRGKYASTPFGTVELRRFFPIGVKAGGEAFAQDDALRKLGEIVGAEDRSSPLSDARLAAAMADAGYPVARRTIAKYRGILGIPEIAERKTAS